MRRELTAEATPGGLRGAGGQHWSSPFAGKRVHLIGIGGCGMRGLAGVLLRCGARVSGSDRSEGEGLADLTAAGVDVYVGHAPRHIPEGCDMVVHSAAVREENPELREARRRDIPTRKYAEMLGDAMRLRRGIAIAGTHGKSTTSAMVSFVLRQARQDPTFVIGAHVPQLGGSSAVGDGPHFVAEACEYDGSFLNLAPRLATVLNIEEDHLDYYKDLPAIIEAFRAFASLLPSDGVLIANGADRSVEAAVRDANATVETFGLSDASWMATEVTESRGCCRFTVTYGGRAMAEIALQHVPGRHQMSNALAALAIAHHAGVPAEEAGRILGEFRGAARRLTHRGGGRGVDVYDDYGHHPTEVQVTLRALRDHYPDRRLWVIFQPHQHSRTRFLLNDFARSFGVADHLIVPEIYFVRDSETERNAVCSKDLVERVQAAGGDARYLPDFGDIVDTLLASTRPGDLVLTMGAGDVWKIADELVRRLA